MRKVITEKHFKVIIKLCRIEVSRMSYYERYDPVRWGWERGDDETDYYQFIPDPSYKKRQNSDDGGGIGCLIIFVLVVVPFILSMALCPWVSVTLIVLYVLSKKWRHNPSKINTPLGRYSKNGLAIFFKFAIVLIYIGLIIYMGRLMGYTHL
jgi:hypothetical protein